MAKAFTGYKQESVTGLKEQYGDQFTWEELRMFKAREQLDVLDYGDNYYDLKFSFEIFFKRKVDLLEEKAIKNPYFLKTLNQNKKRIYG